MSTTGGTPQGTVLMLDPPDVIRKKVKSAVTDSGSEVRRGRRQAGRDEPDRHHDGRDRRDRPRRSRRATTAAATASSRATSPRRSSPCSSRSRRATRSCAATRPSWRGCSPSGPEKAREASAPTLARDVRAHGLRASGVSKLAQGITRRRLRRRRTGYGVPGACSCSSPIAWSMASRRVIARPRSHSSSNVASPTRERRSSRCRRRVGPSELVVQPGPDDLAEQRSMGIQPKSERGLAVRRGEPRRHLERVREPHVRAALAFDREGLGEEVARPLRVTRLEREKREV